MKDTPAHIGSKEYVNFPEVGVERVPAKIDTGADYSSVWASDIHEENGELVFTLFAPGSHHYTGEPIRTRDYGVTYVRNSFGDGEERYKVRLLIEARGKKIRATMRLADRSHNRYPVLIGKQTLKNRFLVDVAADGVRPADQPRRVLVLTPMYAQKFRKFYESLNAANPQLKCNYITFDDVQFEIFKNTPDCVLLGNGGKLSDYDLIYFKKYSDQPEAAAAITEVAGAQGIKFIDEEAAYYHSRTKLTEYLRLANNGVPVPDSMIISNKYLSSKYDELTSRLGQPFIMKDVAGRKGEANYRVSTRAQFDEICKAAESDPILYVCQRFVENDGDYRLIVLDKEVGLIIERKAISQSHLTKTSQGGHARLVDPEELGAEAMSLAVRAAVVMKRQVAGVDVVFDKKLKKWLVYEVNPSPQMAAGTFLDEKIAIMSRFLERYAEK